MKIVFFGTSDVGLPILSTLLEENEVLAVVTSPDAPYGRKQELVATPIAQFAQSKNLVTLKPTKVKNNPELWEELKNLQADIFIVVSYGKILPSEVINIPQFKTLNVHFSLLPKYRGASPIQYALLNGDTKTGSSIFILDEGMDTGELLASQEVEIAPNDTYLTLANRLANISAPLLQETLKAYKLGAITTEKQNDEEATYTKLIKKEDGLIDWNKSATEIHNQFRAFIAWPGIYTTWQSKKIKILNCEVYDQEVDKHLVNGTFTRNYIVCGNQSGLVIHSLQLEGKKPSTTEDFLRGYPNILNQQLLS